MHPKRDLQYYFYTFYRLHDINHVKLSLPLICVMFSKGFTVLSLKSEFLLLLQKRDTFRSFSKNTHESKSRHRNQNWCPFLQLRVNIHQCSVTEWNRLCPFIPALSIQLSQPFPPSFIKRDTSSVKAAHPGFNGLLHWET